MTTQPETSDFHAFEHAGWKSVAREYHDYFASLTTQAVQPMLDAAGVSGATRLLDVCTGPGYAAAAAAERGASALGMDFSPAMVAQASRNFPRARFLVGDAEHLPLTSKSFHAVVTNFGLLHLARPEHFLREAHRVLRSGGRVAFTVWAPPQEAVAFDIVLRAIQSYGSTNVPLPEGPPFFRFSDPEECRRVLLGAGFVHPEVARAPQVWWLKGSDDLFQAVLTGTVRTGGLLRAQTPEALAAVRDAMRRAVEAYRNGETFDLPMPAVLAWAVKP
jgi:SAM-dependent methyltransferase